MEQFYEQFQSKDYGSKEKILNFIKSISFLLGVFTLLFVNVIIGVAFIALSIGTILYIRNNIVEYEYELTQKDLVITKIMNKSKRKVIGEINISNVTEVKTINDAKRTNRKVITACLDEIGIKDQVIFTKTETGLIGYHVAMDDKLLGMASRINPLCFRGL